MLIFQDPELAPSREELLQSHLKNWSNVRRRWRAASLRNEERYAASKEILTKMFERFVFSVEIITTVVSRLQANLGHVNEKVLFKYTNYT